MKYVARLFPVGLLSLTALVACTDPLEAPTAALQPNQALDARGALRDGEIDRSDTHFGARVVTTIERQDGEALRAAADPRLMAVEDEVYIEGGYGSDGRMRFTVYFESAKDSPRIGSMRLVGNELHTFDRRGVRIRTELANDALAAAGLPGGEHAQAFFSAAPPTCPPEAPECAVVAASLQAESAAAAESDTRVMRVRPGARRAVKMGTDVEIEQRFGRARRASGDAPEAWRLQEVRRTSRELRDGREQVTAVVTRYVYRTWERDEKKERSRARALAARAAGGAAMREPLQSVVGPSPAPLVPRDPTLLGQVCAQGTATLDRFRPTVTRGYDVIYQHGFCSDADVFFRFDERLAQSIAVQRSRAFSLASTDRIDAQAADLRGRLTSKGPRRHLFIGHSQGGLVVRRVAQLSPELVTGVITVGTPHAGAHLATWGPEAAQEYLERTIRRECFSDPICRWVDDIVADFMSGLLLFGRDAGAPALLDLAPGSSFLRKLNSTYETFPRVSIEVDAGRRWALARMVGDSRSSQDRLLRGERPGGDARVTEMQNIYGTAKFLHYFSMAAVFNTYVQSRGINCDRAGYSSLWPGCTDPLRDFSAQWNTLLLLYLTYDVTGRIMDIMDSIDRTWDDLTTRRADETDGLVHLASQRYPAVPGAFAPQRLIVPRDAADSHAGAMKSPGVLSSTFEAIGRIEGRTP